MNGPRKNRFDEIYREGTRASGRLIRLHVLPGNGLVGIATSRDIGSKPRRNAQKRRIREALKALSANNWENRDRVVLAKTVCAQATYKEIFEELALLHERIEQRWAENSESF